MLTMLFVKESNGIDPILGCPVADAQAETEILPVIKTKSFIRKYVPLLDEYVIPVGSAPVALNVGKKVPCKN